MGQEEQIRLAAFKWLEEQTRFDDVLLWSTLQKGFDYQGKRVTLVGPQGIWKPKVFQFIPLSICTSAKSPYSDGFTKDGLLLYKYRGTDPQHPDNRGLRQAMIDRVPLIYFHGIVPGRYLPAWPVFVVADDPRNLTFTVAVDDRHHALIGQDAVSEIDDYRRRYVTASFKVRLHQRAFRTRVLAAYRNQCAFCRLRHAELLDAAHITPDSDLRGEPVVTNGLSLCKIHHAAYDRHFIGVSPDFEIIVREDLLAETDGPMLRYGIQEIHRQKLVLPAQKKQWPNQERLAERYELFQKVI